MRDFELSRFVICTDAGLSSDANRRFNNYGERSFITTQSVKKLIEGYDEERDIAFNQMLIVTYSLKCKIYQQTDAKSRNRSIS